MKRLLIFLVAVSAFGQARVVPNPFGAGSPLEYIPTPTSGPGSGTVTSITQGCGQKLSTSPLVATGTISSTGPCLGTGAGTAQAQTATYSPSVTSLTNGLWLCWIPTAANTATAPTFAPDGLTAHTIVKAGGALLANDILTTAQACAIYNTTGTQWELQNPQSSILFPYSTNKGSLVGVGIGGVLTNSSWFPGTVSNSGCINAGGLWLLSGTFRNVTVSTSNSNPASPIAVGVDPGCLVVLATLANTYVPAPAQGGPIIPANAGAGGFTSPTTYSNFWHQEAMYAFAFAANKLGLSNTTAVVATDIAAEFVDDAGLHHTIIPNGSISPLTASSTQFIGFYGVAVNSTELNIAVPIPIAGTIDGSTMCDGATPTATVAVTLRKNSGAGGSNGFTMPTNTGCMFDQTNTVAVVAGDYIDMQTVSGVTTQLQPVSSAVSFFPADGLSTIVGGYLGATTVTTTKTFNAPLTAKTSTTEASAQTVLPVAESCTNLYVVKATANSGVTTTYTIRDNGVDTAITGTESSGTGALAIYTGSAVPIAAGHKIDLAYVTASGTSGVMAGWAMACQ